MRAGTAVPRTLAIAGLAACFAFIPHRASAEEPSAAEARGAVVLAPVVVTATRVPEPLTDIAASVSIVDQPDIQDARRTVGVEEPLARVPGVFAQSSDNFAQDVRIQIRGFGTRAAFGVREIKVLVDGLPETMPDGQTELDAVDLGAVEHIEVLRGPASSLYGNAAGGVIQFFTEDGPPVPRAEVRLTGGSFGLGKYQLKAGGQLGKVNLFMQGSYLQLDGYRDQSAARSGLLNAKLRYDFSPDTAVTLLLNGVDAPTAEDPGGLTRRETITDPRKAAPLNKRLDTGEEVQQGRLGAVARHRTGNGELTAYAYGLYRDFENRLPIPQQNPPNPTQGGWVAFHRFSPGGGVRYTLAVPLLGWTPRLTGGVDVQYQDDERRRFDNLNGQRGALGLHQREQVTSVGPYARVAVPLRDDLEVNAGLRYDSTRFEVDVDVPSAAGSGARTLDQWSPSGGVRYSPRRWLTLFGDIGTAFQVPTTTELANPAGAGFNPDVQPQTAVSYELGSRADFDRVRAGASAFLTEIDDELIPFDNNGRTFYRNAGRSRRYGIELDGHVELLPSLTWTSAFTFLRAEFRDYSTAAGNFDGNREPGIPPWQIFQELAYRHWSGLFAAAEIQILDSYFVDDANQHEARGYAVCNLRSGYEYTAGRWGLRPFVGLNNITDTPYDGRVRLNAQAERFFEPAPGFNVYGGLAVSAQL